MITKALDNIRSTLAGYVFRVRSEAELQGQVRALLEQRFGGYPTTPDALVECEAIIEEEVRVPGGRFDVSLVFQGERAVRIVLELKLNGSVSEVERQAQRYALMPAVDAVMVVTTSSRLAANLMAPGDVGQPPLPTLGGKPFGVIALRTS